MAYTFGGGTGDDITWNVSTLTGSSARVVFVSGWWRPTTLTATRGLWSAGNVFGAEIDTTTDELRLRTDNTTDGQWTTTGVDLVVDEWKFISFLSSNLNGTPTAAWRVWAGTVEAPPVEVTVTVATAPVGNFTGSSSFYVGNKGTGTVAFQGDIADVAVISSAAAASAVNNPLGIATHGAISNTEAQYVYETLVTPMWLGDTSVLWRRAVGFNSEHSAYFNSLDVLSFTPGNSYTFATVSGGVTNTVNGAVPSQFRGPRARHMHPLLPMPRR